jgi:hypothetical protein
MAAHVYWRLNFATPNNGNNPAICELAMHTSVGGADVCTGGTAGGTNINGSFPAANAFDGNLTSTDCQTTATPSTISYQFGSAKAIVEYVVTASATLAATYGPQTWTFDYSDDGAAWTVAAYARGQVSWGVSEARTFPVNAGAGTAQQFKALSPATSQGVASAGGSVQLGHAPTPGPKTVSGTVTVNGVATAGLLVRAYAKVTGEYIGQATTDGSGNYAIQCGANWADVYVLAFDPSVGQALVFDQIVPA